MNLNGKNVIITGGSQGFGRHIVEAFLNAGANVIFCARTEADIRQAVSELSPLVRPNQIFEGSVCDISSLQSIEALFARARALGPLHAVVNNAGVYGPIGPSEEISLDEWDRAWSINVTGTLMMCREAIREMKPRKLGKIINISGGGATNPMPRFASYAASKAAVVRLTETLAEEYRDDGIAVNAIAPGALRTRLTQQVLAAGPEQAGAAFFAKNKKWAEEGAADPKLGANLCVWLASSDSDGVSGKLISAQWDPWREPEKFKNLATGDVYTLRRIVPEDRVSK